MYWVIQNNLFNEVGYTSLIEVMDRMELKYKVVRVVPFADKIIDINFESEDFTGDINNIPDIEVDTDDNVCVLGATSLIRISKLKQWFPGAFLNENMNYNVWKLHWGDNLLNYESHVCEFKDVDKWYDTFFIRPTKDSKSFNGSVYKWEDFVKWKEDVVNQSNSKLQLNENTEVMVSPLKEIYSEVRYFIVDGKIVTASQYKLGKQVIHSTIISESNIEYAQKMIDIWCPDRAFVIDIADTSDGYKIVECNCINSAGFYDCDVSKIVNAINDMKF